MGLVNVNSMVVNLHADHKLRYAKLAVAKRNIVLHIYATSYATLNSR